MSDDVRRFAHDSSCSGWCIGRMFNLALACRVVRSNIFNFHIEEVKTP